MTNQNFVKNRYDKVCEYDVPASQLSVREARKIPNVPNDVKYDEVAQMDLAIIFADIRGYTKLIERSAAKVAARIMSIYVTEMAAAIRFHQGTIVSIEGDGIIGAFKNSEKNNASTLAVRAVVTMNTLLNYVINKRLRAFQQSALHCGYGVDCGRLYITRAGIHGEGKNELLFIGDAMTRAAKLQSKANQNEVYISKRCYDQLEDFYKKSSEGWSWSSTYVTDLGTIYRKTVNSWRGTEEP